MDGFVLKIVTPDGREFEDEVKALLVKTTLGDVGILKNHTNFMATIDYGRVKITYPDGRERGACCMNGFLSVDQSQTRIIATTFEFADEIDVARATRSKEAAEAKLSEQDISDEEQIYYKARLLRAKNRLRVHASGT